jgi:hypothetical protein
MTAQNDPEIDMRLWNGSRCRSIYTLELRKACTCSTVNGMGGLPRRGEVDTATDSFEGETGFIDVGIRQAVPTGCSVAESLQAAEEMA